MLKYLYQVLIDGVDTIYFLHLNAPLQIGEIVCQPLDKDKGTALFSNQIFYKVIGIIRVVEFHSTVNNSTHFEDVLHTPYYEKDYKELTFLINAELIEDREMLVEKYAIDSDE
jgi:hypothetical protein